MPQVNLSKRGHLQPDEPDGLSIDRPVGPLITEHEAVTESKGQDALVGQVIGYLQPESASMESEYSLKVPCTKSNVLASRWPRLFRHCNFRILDERSRPILADLSPAVQNPHRRFLLGITQSDCRISDNSDG